MKTSLVSYNIHILLRSTGFISNVFSYGEKFNQRSNDFGLVAVLFCNMISFTVHL
jgi:hypothetical protein